MLSEPIEIKMTSHQIAMARMHMVYLHPLRKKSSWIVLAVIGGLSLTANYIMGGDGESVAGLLVGFLGLCGSWFLLNYTRERGNKAAARMYAEGFSLTQREEGLLYQVGEAFEILPWTKFSKTAVTRKWFYIYFTNRFALIIPRSAYVNEEKYQVWIKAAQDKIPKLERIDQSL